MIKGCQRSKLCSPNPCQNNGICIDQWDEFRCECKKPFLPPYCIQQTAEVTFGYDNLKSRLEIDGERNFQDIKLNTNIDLLIRTNKPNGTLLYLGEKVTFALPNIQDMRFKSFYSIYLKALASVLGRKETNSIHFYR